MVIWIAFGIFIILFFLAYLVYIYFRDRHFERRSASETMRPEMWDEIAKEREENMLKAKKFKEALEQARVGKKGGS